MQECILILGMHRSGTSALSGILNIMGIHQGTELLAPTEANPKGFFENTNILAFNEKVLKEHGYTWDALFFNDKTLRIDIYAEELKALIIKEFGGARFFSIKDPRICLLFPVYEKALTEMGIVIRPIIIYRNPIETALSLQKRDGFSWAKGLILWMDHFLFSESHTRSYSRLFVSFDRLLENYHEFISAINNQWQMGFDISPEQQKKFQSFLCADLKHINLSMRHFSLRLPDPINQLLPILLFPQEINNRIDQLEEIRKTYFRDKEFFFLEEFKESIKEVNPCNYAQFYIDTGQGFSENQSRRVFKPDGVDNLELDLSEFADLRSIRFDPLNQAVAVSIVSAAFQLTTDEWIQTEARPLNACHISDEADYFSHEDPQYYIPVPHTRHATPRRLVIKAIYHGMGSKDVAPATCIVLRQILQRQRHIMIKSIITEKERWRSKYETDILHYQSMLHQIEQRLEMESMAKMESEQNLKKVINELETKEAINRQLMAENQRVSMDLQNLYNSKTWRLTKPLRDFISWWI